MTVHEIHSPAVLSRQATRARQVPSPARTHKPFLTWRWSPRELDRRGRRIGREEERAYRDLQAAASAADWR
jgi:hypothetical protein